MTTIKPDGDDADDGAADEFLNMAVEHYSRALRVFQRTTSRVEAGQQAPTPETDRVIRQYGSATETLLKEKRKLENSIKTDAGIVYDFALDLEGAREEIRRRMACLRDAGDTGDVSE